MMPWTQNRFIRLPLIAFATGALVGTLAAVPEFSASSHATAPPAIVPPEFHLNFNLDNLDFSLDSPAEAASSTAASSPVPCTLQPCSPTPQSHPKLQSQRKLRDMQYVWGQMSLPARPSTASPAASRTLERAWFAGCRWWQLHAPKP
jgi:hypothetical protein